MLGVVVAYADYFHTFRFKDEGLKEQRQSSTYLSVLVLFAFILYYSTFFLYLRKQI
jgi:hypothetical protein